MAVSTETFRKPLSVHPNETMNGMLMSGISGDGHDETMWHTLGGEAAHELKQTLANLRKFLQTRAPLPGNFSIESIDGGYDLHYKDPKIVYSVTTNHCAPGRDIYTVRVRIPKGEMPNPDINVAYDATFEPLQPFPDGSLFPQHTERNSNDATMKAIAFINALLPTE